MIKNVRTSIENNIKVFLLTPKVGCEDLDCTLGHAVVDGTNSGCPCSSASIFEIVTCYGCDHGVLEIHAGD
jgi:hypothetical protein